MAVASSSVRAEALPPETHPGRTGYQLADLTPRGRGGRGQSLWNEVDAAATRMHGSGLRSGVFRGRAEGQL